MNRLLYTYKDRERERDGFLSKFIYTTHTSMYRLLCTYKDRERGREYQSNMYPETLCKLLKSLDHIAGARKLEHHGPHALTAKYRESQHESS